MATDSVFKHGSPIASNGTTAQADRLIKETSVDIGDNRMIAANLGGEAMSSAQKPPASTPPIHDWGEEWRQLRAFRRHEDQAAYWNERAKTFFSTHKGSPYVKRFLELAEILPGETVFDMGCGTGTLCIPLGKSGHRVLAGDFSTEILKVLQGQLASNDIKCVTPKLMSWADDWDACGVHENAFDVCLASRSVSTDDLEDALFKLTRTAKRRVCITLAAGSTPRCDDRILEAAGFSNVQWRDHIYAFNILATHGINAEVSYIESARHDSYDSFDEALQACYAMLMHSDEGRTATQQKLEEAYERLHVWVKDELVENENAGMPARHGNIEKAFRFKEPRIISWAFLAWNKSG